MAQPMLARLLQKRPDLPIDMLAPKWVLPVAERMPEVSEAIESPFGHGDFDLRGRWRLGRSLARRGYAQAVVLPNTFKSALAPFFADIPLRSGYVGESRYGLLNILHKLDRKNPPPMVERYLALAGPPGEPLPAVSPSVPHTRLAASGANLARALVQLSLAPPSDEHPVAVLCPGAEYGPAKRWPAEHYADLAAKLGEAGFSVWLMGSQADKPVARAILEARPGCATDLCGRTDLASAIDLIAAAQVVISNDSGLMHIAAALDRPLVALFGSSSPRHTPPRSGKARIEYLAIECSPCFARVCPLGHFRCMRELSPARIFGEALAAAGRVR
jgi:heptosyltransferase-2